MTQFQGAFEKPSHEDPGPAAAAPEVGRGPLRPTFWVVAGSVVVALAALLQWQTLDGRALDGGGHTGALVVESLLSLAGVLLLLTGVIAAGVRAGIVLARGD